MAAIVGAVFRSFDFDDCSALLADFSSFFFAVKFFVVFVSPRYQRCRVRGLRPYFLATHLNVRFWGYLTRLFFSWNWCLASKSAEIMGNVLSCSVLIRAMLLYPGVGVTNARVHDAKARQLPTDGLYFLRTLSYLRCHPNARCVSRMTSLTLCRCRV